MGRLLFSTFFLALLLWLSCGQITVLVAQKPQPSDKEEKVFRVARMGDATVQVYVQTVEMIKDYLNRVGWGHKVVFPEELHFHVGMEGDKSELLTEMAKGVLARDDYDLLLSFGTIATHALLNENKQGRPMIGLDVTDPMSTGLVNAPDDSGRPFFTTLVYSDPPGQYMFLLFHSLGKFKKMGIMYHDSHDSRGYVYLDAAREVARDQGFELVEYSRLTQGELLENCLEGVRWLITQEVDALFIPPLTCFTSRENDLKPIFDLIYENQIMTFAVDDRFVVRNFAFMGLLLSDLNYLADHHARQIIDIFSGKSPGALDMAVPVSSRLLINMAAAARLGIKMGPRVVSLSDELYLSLSGFASPSGSDDYIPEDTVENSSGPVLMLDSFE